MVSPIDLLFMLPPLTYERLDRLIVSLMELFCEARLFRKVHWLYRRMKEPNDEAFALLLKAVVRSNISDKGVIASRLLHETMQQQRFPLTTRLATLTLLAWAKSGSPLTMQKALQIHEQVLHKFSQKAQSIEYYNALLDCIASTGGGEAVHHTDSLLQQIRKDGLEPNETSYTLAIKAFLKGGKDDRAELLLDEMKNSPFPPKIETFNTIMAFHAKQSCFGAAIQVEQIVLELHRQSKTNPEVAPDVVSYNSIYEAWANSDIEFASNRMMKVFERMHRMNIEPNLETYTKLIYHFTNTGSWGDMGRAQYLLTLLEDHPTLQPDTRHYYRIMQAWNLMEVPEFGEEILKRRIKAYLNGNTKVAPVR